MQWRLVSLLGLCLSVYAQTPSFFRDVYPSLKKADCRGCHNADGVSSTTRLLFPEESASEAEWDAFGDSLRALVDREHPEQSLLLNKPTNRVKHAGGLRLHPGSAEEAALKEWVRHLATTTATKRAKVVVAAGEKTALRRMTHAQYDNTVRDLLGDATGPSRQFPPEDFVDGFKNQYSAQGISPLLAEAYGAAAEKLAASAAVKDTGPGFVDEFGRKAFHRPLAPNERIRYLALHKKGGARLVMEAMLQSPAFLYRLESGVTPSQKAYARASRLSYLLWDTMPDEKLMAAAASGELNTQAGLVAVARGMLQQPKAKQGTDEFISQWLRFDRLVNMVKDRRSYPMFNRELAVAMTEETRRFASGLIWSDADFMDFFRADYSFLNTDLATLYKTAAPEEEFSKVTFSADSPRAGILGHAAFLALTSKPSDTSPTARGLFVREQFLCQQVPQPPPGVNANLPVSREDKPLTNRERLAVHLENASCAVCHNLIDPIGFGLEKFDGIGAYREKAKVDIIPYDRKENVKSVQLPIDASGHVAGIQRSDFTTPKELGRVLAATPQCQECVVKQYFRYAMGRHESATDKPLIEKVTADFRKSGFRFQEMMISLIQATEFPGRD